MQIFQAKAGVQLCGLSGFLQNFKPETLLTVELQRTKQAAPEDKPTVAKVLVLNRYSAGNSGFQLCLDQSIDLQLKEPVPLADASFAQLPSGNVLCAMPFLEFVYEIKRSFGGKFDENPVAHRMPARVRHICDFKVGDDWRLTASLFDNSIRQFRMTAAGGLELVNQLSPPAGN